MTESLGFNDARGRAAAAALGEARAAARELSERATVLYASHDPATDPDDPFTQEFRQAVQPGQRAIEEFGAALTAATGGQDDKVRLAKALSDQAEESAGEQSSWGAHR